ncbi:hypothetical protein MGYG_08014 [Nannizzia gypsea CBS 118893]|uniref:Uncharacterized protein n=1 Tax=Arthroderma gypseum (strain ATCC MYA-4604 / CBS 118893) TaxID=535722 RepID=E4V4T7_ARTGP|nr:hypothetical protein MGYG_08014 [Nannizzia gypsea CBS 118893]EFR05011.1 hypothetical protein MGYG_08014 [Nannizzia gypsea CBS 118893]
MLLGAAVVAAVFSAIFIGIGSCTDMVGTWINYQNGTYRFDRNGSSTGVRYTDDNNSNIRESAEHNSTMATTQSVQDLRTRLAALERGDSARNVGQNAAARNESSTATISMNCVTTQIFLTSNSSQTTTSGASEGQVTSMDGQVEEVGTYLGTYAENVRDFRAKWHLVP